MWLEIRIYYSIYYISIPNLRKIPVVSTKGGVCIYFAFRFVYHFLLLELDYSSQEAAVLLVLFVSNNILFPKQIYKKSKRQSCFEYLNFSLFNKEDLYVTKNDDLMFDIHEYFISTTNSWKRNEGMSFVCLWPRHCSQNPPALRRM